MVWRLFKGCLVLLILCILLFVAVLLSWRWCLNQIGSFLVYDQPPVPCEAIVAVSGEQARRSWAVELYKRGYSETIIFNVSDTTYYFGQGVDPVESVRRMASERKIPESAIILNSDIKSTWDDAVATKEKAEEMGLKSLIIVSTPFNMRRVKMSYEFVFKDLPVKLTFCSVPMEKMRVSTENWWTREQELQLVVIEYLKIIFYYYKHFL